MFDDLGAVNDQYVIFPFHYDIVMFCLSMYQISAGTSSIKIAGSTCIRWSICGGVWCMALQEMVPDCYESSLIESSKIEKIRIFPAGIAFQDYLSKGNEWEFGDENASLVGY